MEELSFKGFLEYTYRNWLEKLLNENPYSDMLPDEMKKQGIDGLTPNFSKENNPNQDFNIPLNLNNSYLSLTIAPNNFPKDSNDSSSTTSPIAFKITKAHIKESLEELFAVECEGYIESMQEQ
ncbi:hypothetical protein, partial [Helicobacter pullorum]|uniref:hypothetical protein n=1 Tax=Helicobacter pullorum TaxID=35818 RepID=UPI0018C2EF99